MNENENRETLADIEAELRELSRSGELATGARYSEPQPTVHGKPIGIYFSEIADRIEASAKREKAEAESDALAVGGIVEAARTAGKSSAVGNAAAMREALVALRDAARSFCHQILNSKYNDIMDEYKCRERGFPALLDLRYAIPKANFALSAPPRNCDVYKTAKDALKAQEKAFDESNFKHGECKLGCPDCDDYAIRCEIKWLFAPAAEREKAEAESEALERRALENNLGDLCHED